MEKPFALAALFSVLALPAFAATPNSRAASEFAPPPPPAFSWSGFYLGGNAGISAGNFNTSEQPGGYGINDAYNADSRGFSGGGQAGYNYQLPGLNYVVGIEADFQGSTLKGTYDSFESGEGGWQNASKVNWWGTVRGRFGYAVGNLLPFVTGGLAYGNVQPMAVVGPRRYGHFHAANPKGRFQGRKSAGRQAWALNMRSPAS